MTNVILYRMFVALIVLRENNASFVYAIICRNFLSTNNIWNTLWMQLLNQSTIPQFQLVGVVNMNLLFHAALNGSFYSDTYSPFVLKKCSLRVYLVLMEIFSWIHFPKKLYFSIQHSPKFKTISSGLSVKNISKKSCFFLFNETYFTRKIVFGVLFFFLTKNYYFTMFFFNISKIIHYWHISL